MKSLGESLYESLRGVINGGSYFKPWVSLKDFEQRGYEFSATEFAKKIRRRDDEDTLRDNKKKAA